VHILETLARAAPRLRVLDAGVVRPAHAVMACAMLRNEVPYGALRVRQLELFCLPKWPEPSETEEFIALAAAIAGHEHLTGVRLDSVQLSAHGMLDALVDAALARSMCRVSLASCCLPAAVAPPLARLLRGGTLATLDCNGGRWDEPMFADVPAAVLLGDALRACHSITSLSLIGCQLWGKPGVGAALVGSLVGHPSLEELSIGSHGTWYDGASAPAAAGAALGALVAANAPALRVLNVSGCHLDDTSIGPLFDALPRNMHLSTLVLYKCLPPQLSEAFARERVLPAVRANASLLYLALDWPADELPAAAQEAVQLVEARKAARGHDDE
jgi:hypothetical protein